MNLPSRGVRTQFTRDTGWIRTCTASLSGIKEFEKELLLTSANPKVDGANARINLDLSQDSSRVPFEQMNGRNDLKAKGALWRKLNRPVHRRPRISKTPAAYKLLRHIKKKCIDNTTDPDVLRRAKLQIMILLLMYCTPST